MNNYDVFMMMLFAKAEREKIPLSGTFELTSRCTLNCKMCYIHRSQNCEEVKAKEKSTGWWLQLAEKARASGMLMLLLTGGEPLLRDDFKEIYLGCRKLGLLVSVNTNGTLVDKDMVEFFKAYPPQRLNVSLYGTSPETYQKLCGNGEAYYKAVNAITSLKEAGVNVRINYTITPLNENDTAGVQALGESLGVEVRIVSYMFAPVRAGNGEAFRLSECEAAKAEFDWRQRRTDGSFEKFVQEIVEGKAPHKPEDSTIPQRVDDLGDDCGERINCRAGSTTFWVTWDGEMRPCGMMTVPTVIVNGFDDAWREIRRARENIILPSECTNCSIRKHCDMCAAVSFAETGRFDGVPGYACKKAKELRRLCKSYLNHFENL